MILLPFFSPGDSFLLGVFIVLSFSLFHKPFEAL